MKFENFIILCVFFIDDQRFIIIDTDLNILFVWGIIDKHKNRIQAVSFYYSR